MNALLSLLAVGVLIGLAALASGAGLGFVFAVVLPYLAILLFLGGFIAKIVGWAKSPVPFRIPTVSGQQKALDWIPQNKLESPVTGFQVFVRMALEVLFFRSLFRNTRAELREGPRLVYAADKFLWLFALLFHWSFLVIFIRHLRFFTEPVPFFVTALESLDGFFEVGIPFLFLTDLAILAALAFLLGRRFANPQVRYISLFADYFPLFLILGIVVTGVLMRHFAKVDIHAVKALGVSLLSLSPAVPAGLGALFFIHLFLVTTLIAYFPWSKLMHLGGVFMSPTRNLANNNRTVRHVNPWNPDVKPHSFDAWKEEFKDEIAQAGYKLERD
ncbi:MAG: sulfate reduction electron transfer complex DsrMKJOP subunit DsrM [Planctomycetes bacterium]|jgi:nitrate reductase gamma subunit|nr:sulfate reduction electron transfer complex DsrMKJOP subunit DsrM [Planctomycetota bacterium]